jgi:mannitol/fructose-specific phosphotransferase system IIA component (Ntr-type)
MLPALQKSCIAIGTVCKTKNDILKQISELACKSRLLETVPSQKILEKLIEREEVSSTGLENGIAIPHCSINGLSGFTVGLLIVPQGTAFESLDGRPSNLIFFIVGPPDQRSRHIQIISSIAKLTKDRALISKLINCNAVDTVFNLLQQDIRVSEINPESDQFCQFIIHIQNEDFFADAMEILGAESGGAISVLETNTAGYYLHKLPLFSTFWTTSEPNFSRVIFAVINKKLMNNTLRRLSLLSGDSKSGMMVTVQDILYCDGSIDF